MSQLRIGVSGWNYRHWRGGFYPKGLVQRRELEYVASRMNSVEINGSFYSLQRPSSYQAWYDQTPKDFVFAVKGGRYITQMRKLRDVRVPLANFFASGVLCLKQKLGTILWQLPPHFRLDIERFEAFFRLLPRDTQAAAKLAREHDEKLKHGAWTKADKKRPIRYAVEVRHRSYFVPEFIALLRKYKVALVFADTAQRFPYAEDVTADLVYLRLHGDTELYASGYSDSALNWWAARIRAWRDGSQPADAKLSSQQPPPKRRHRDAYVYFDNDARGHAPVDAINLMKRLEAG